MAQKLRPRFSAGGVITFCDLFRISRFFRTCAEESVLEDYIVLGPVFVEELLEVYEKWRGRDTLPTKLKELMSVLEVELSNCRRPDVRSAKVRNSQKAP